VNRKAFTLFELMIVVMLVGVTYALVLSNFNTKKKVKILHIQDIKETLLPFWKKGTQVDFYLYDNCEKSAIFINSVYQEELEININMKEFKKVEVYKADYRGESQKQEFVPIMIGKKLYKVCFKFSIFKNGSNSSYILKQDKNYFIFYPYFEDNNETDDLNQALDLLQHKEYRGVTPDEVND